MMKCLWFILLVASVYGEGEEVEKDFVPADYDFTIKLLTEMMKGNNDNIAVSSYSLETLLALTSLGAKGVTKEEIKKVVNLPQSDEKIKTAFFKVASDLSEIQHATVRSANKIYIGKQFEIESDFAKIASEDFGAGIENVDFGDSVKASNEINTWVKDKTQNKIQNIVKEDQVNSLTRMILVNALYFKGTWKVPFDRQGTEKRDFHLSKTEKIQVDTMRLAGNILIYRNEEYKVTVLKLLYNGSPKPANLLIIIPDEIDGLDEVQKNIYAIAAGQNYTRDYIKVFLPKFRVETTTEFKPILQKIGLNSLFGRSDLSGITKESIVVDAINQKVFIDVNEFGTEAAAATAVFANARTLIFHKEDPTEYHVDRPFLFCLQYDQTDLMTGRVTNPSLK